MGGISLVISELARLKGESLYGGPEVTRIGPGGAASLRLRKVTHIGGTAGRGGAAPQAVGTAGWGVHCRQGCRQGPSQ